MGIVDGRDSNTMGAPSLTVLKVITLLCLGHCQAGLLGAGTGGGSCRAAPYRTPASQLQWPGGCPTTASCCSEFGYCRTREEWASGGFRDCNGQSNGRPLEPGAYAAERAAAARGDTRGIPLLGTDAPSSSGAPGYSAPGTGYGSGSGAGGAPGFGSGSPGYGSGIPGYGSGSPGFGSGSPGFGSGGPGYGSGSPGYGAGGAGNGAGSPGSGSGGGAGGPGGSAFDQWLNALVDNGGAGRGGAGAGGPGAGGAGFGGAGNGAGGAGSEGGGFGGAGFGAGASAGAGGFYG